MTEWKDMPFSGVECDEKTKMCKAWFAQSQDNITKSVELNNIPAEKFAVRVRDAELRIGDRLQDTLLNID